MPAAAPSYYQIAVPSIQDRAFWDRIATDPKFAAAREQMDRLAAAAPLEPRMPSAIDFLSAKRANNRKLLDDDWQTQRATLGALVLRRCILGPAEDDDRLMNWLWAYLTMSTWVVSAHLPGFDLPAGEPGQLDLAACEIACSMAETREALKPWLDRQSATFSDRIVYEIDRRTLTPFVNTVDPIHWARLERDVLSNWTAVCAGGLPGACESLAAQGHQRPAAKSFCVALLRGFMKVGFTPAGECDEGAGYWNYGMGFMTMGLSRLSEADLHASFDLPRFRHVADYPRRSHLFGNRFFTVGDGALTASPSGQVKWIAAATGSAWLDTWVGKTPTIDGRDFSSMLRVIDALDRPASTATIQDATEPTRFLEDQRAMLLHLPGPRGTLHVQFNGGHNAQNHNHNDLGHFVIYASGDLVVPDLGVPWYTPDFFGSKRYEHLPASSRGHNCPLINGIEQYSSRAAADVVKRLHLPSKTVTLDLTAAYLPAARLKKWERSLAPSGDGCLHFFDVFETDRNSTVVQSVYFMQKPERIIDDGIWRVGPLIFTLSPPPQSTGVITINPADHALRITATPCTASTRHTTSSTRIEIEMQFGIA